MGGEKVDVCFAWAGRRQARNVVDGRDIWWHDVMAKDASGRLPGRGDGRRGPAVHPLHLRLDRQAQGRAAHVGGYMVYTAITHKYIFDYHDGDVYWCTADIGWVTGHSYIVYGPLANGAITIMFEGVPTYPDAGRFWDVVDKYKVTPVLHRPHRDPRPDGRGRRVPEAKRDLSSLEVLGSVGEPINPEAWLWYHRNIGNEKLPDRGHLVADRDRRHPHHAAARRHAAQARQRHLPVLRRQAGRARSENGQPVEGNGVDGVLASPSRGPARCGRSTATHDRFEETYFRCTRASTSRVTAAAATRTATTGSPVASTT
jgi:acetyl-CoA synthetase